MPSVLEGTESTVPGLLCPFDGVNPIVLYPVFDLGRGVWYGLGWECTVDPLNHNGVALPLPAHVSLLDTDYDPSSTSQ